MFVVKRNLAGSLICALISFSCFSANGHDADSQLQQRIELQSAEIDILKAQLALETWKCSQIKDFHSKGFASWLELQRQRLNVDAVQARFDSANAFENVLKQIDAENRAVADDELIAFRERTSKPIKVFIPGSVRLIGWIEGKGFADLKTDETSHQQVSVAEAKLAKAQKRFDAFEDSQNPNVNHRKYALLNLNLAKAELEHAKLFRDVHKQPMTDASELAVSFENLKQYVTAEQSPELKIATSNVAQAEIAATGHIKLANSMLERQQRRTAALRDLQAQGIASPKELESAMTRLSEFQSQLDAYTKNLEILRQSGTSRSSENQPAAEYRSVTSWPAIVLHDDEFTLHLIDLRRKYHEEQVNRVIAEKRLALLKQVLPRLKEAELSPEKVKTKFQLTLQEGQRNEIKSYESEIEIVAAAAVFAVEKQQILVQEEARFILQAVAQYEAARDSLAAANRSTTSAVGLLSLTTSSVGMLVRNESSAAAPRFSYLESNASFERNKSASLLFSYQNLDFVGAPYEAKSLYRFNLRPARDLMLASDSLQSYSKTSGINSDPHWMNYFRQNYKRNTYSTLPYGSRPYTNNYPNVNYGFSRTRPFGTYSAYPYGILRPDLRSHITPGQLPWYLPGSPSNVRRNQLPYSYRSRSYRH